MLTLPKLSICEVFDNVGVLGEHIDELILRNISIFVLLKFAKELLKTNVD